MRPPGRLIFRIGSSLALGGRQRQQFSVQAIRRFPTHPQRPGLHGPAPHSQVLFQARTLSSTPANLSSATASPPPSPAPPSSTTSTTSAPVSSSTSVDIHNIQTGYFLSNTILARIAGVAGAPGASPSLADGTPELLPHRRRQAARRSQIQASSATVESATLSPTVLHSLPSDDSAHLPANASAVLTDMAAGQTTTSLRRLLPSLLSLAKPRLTVLVVLSAMAPYALYPVPDFLESASLTATPSLSPLTLLFLTVGTTLCSAAANALNMLYEPDTDSLMSRTRNRPLVRLLISRRAALAFAVACAALGVAALHFGVNSTVAFLGAANIALYAGVYTPMKRLSVWNTWVGALVGGIPPLMGWAAAAGESATGGPSTIATSDAKASTSADGLQAQGNTAGRSSEFRELLFAPDGSSAGGWLLAGLLFAWQFPHFMALSWPVRNEYRRAGLRMLAWVDPARNARVALRYSLAFVPICVGLCVAHVTEWSFAITSLPANGWLVREAVRFWRLEGHQGSARSLFWASVWHLLVLMVLALLQKQGMWSRVWRSVMGQSGLDGDDGDGDYYDDDWEDDGEVVAKK